jgi:hypothetical protein
MKVIYVNEIGKQLGLSVPYNLDGKIRIGDIISKEKLWGKEAEELEDMVITNVEIENHYIFCTLRTFKKY